MRASRWKMGVVFAIVALGGVGCGSASRTKPSNVSPGGTLRMALTGQTNGTTYRLRSATFDIAGPTTTTLDSETDPAAAVLTASLAVGTYSISLRSGWFLERLEGTSYVTVAATLVSPNPTTFTISSETSTTVVYQFETAGAVVSVGPGTLGVNVAVQETQTYTLAVAPVTLAGGTEQTRCVTLRLANTDAMLVRKIELLSDAGTVQVVVYRSSASTEVPNPGISCAPLDGLGAGHPLFMANQLSASLAFRDDGSGNPVGPVIAAGQMLKIEAHFLNVTATSLSAGTRLVVEAIPVPATAVASDMAVFTTTNLTTPPRTTFVHSFFQPWSLPGSKVLAFNTQQWRFGTRVEVYRASTSSDRSELLLDDTDWQHPPIHASSPALDVGGGKGFLVDCQTTNTSDGTVTFGLSALNDDTCLLWQYYYPAAGFQFCVNGGCTTTP